MANPVVLHGTESHILRSAIMDLNFDGCRSLCHSQQECP